MYKREGISWENIEVTNKLHTDRQKLQNEKFLGPGTSQLEKSPYTFDLAEPLTHADCHVRDPPLNLVTCRPPFFGNRGAEIPTSRGDQRARPHRIPIATRQELRDNPYPSLRWTHIQFRWIQIFLLFYFCSFNIVFEDKPSAVLAS